MPAKEGGEAAQHRARGLKREQPKPAGPRRDKKRVMSSMTRANESAASAENERIETENNVVAQDTFVVKDEDSDEVSDQNVNETSRERLLEAGEKLRRAVAEKLRIEQDNTDVKILRSDASKVKRSLAELKNDNTKTETTVAIMKDRLRCQKGDVDTLEMVIRNQDYDSLDKMIDSKRAAVKKTDDELKKAGQHVTSIKEQIERKKQEYKEKNEIATSNEREIRERREFWDKELVKWAKLCQ